MKWKLLEDKEGGRAYLLVFAPGDEVDSELLRFVKDRRIIAAEFRAIGAFERLTYGFFDLKTKSYEKTMLDEQVEVMSLIGNVARHAGEQKIHAHVVIGKRDGTSHGGHFFEGTVRPTLEMFLNEIPFAIERTLDQSTNLPLIDLNEKEEPYAR